LLSDASPAASGWEVPSTAGRAGRQGVQERQAGRQVR
jgi:hypothetical protein